MSEPSVTSSRSGEQSAIAWYAFTGRRLAKQPSFRTLLPGQAVELLCADRAQQNGVGLQASCQRFLRQRLSILLDSHSTNAMRFETEFVAAHIRDRLQYGNGLLGDFRADSISRRYNNAQLHAGRISGEGPLGSRMLPRWVYSMASRSCS